MPDQNKPLISVKKTLIRYCLVFLLLLCAVLFNKALFRQVLLEIPEIPVSILLWCCLLAPFCNSSFAATAILVFRFSSTIVPFLLGLPSGIHLISLCQNGKMRKKNLSKE